MLKASSVLLVLEHGQLRCNSNDIETRIMDAKCESCISDATANTDANVVNGLLNSPISSVCELFFKIHLRVKVCENQQNSVSGYTDSFMLGIY